MKHNPAIPPTGWKIIKHLPIDITGNDLKTLFAEGSNEYNKTWAARASYIYLPLGALEKIMGQISDQYGSD